MSPKIKPWLIPVIPLLGLPLVFSNVHRIKVAGEMVVSAAVIGIGLYYTMVPGANAGRSTAEVRWWTFAFVALLAVGLCLQQWLSGEVRDIGFLVSFLGLAACLRVIMLRHIGNYQPQ